MSSHWLGSVLWFLLLGTSIRYFQTVVQLSRQYDYIHGLEELMADEFRAPAFTREGKSYRDDYPIFSAWASLLYRYAFPVLLAVIASIRIADEVKAVWLLMDIGVRRTHVF